MDLLLTLDPELPRRTAIERALRDAIADGRLAPGAHLPSSRGLAAELGVARGTVVAAYEQLRTEGLLDARQGTATRVASIPRRATPRAPRADGWPPPRAAAPPGHAAVLADFGGGDPDVSSFPRAAWRRAVTSVLERADDGRFGYGDPLGEPELRAALAEYLGRTRGVLCDVDQIVVTAGFTHCLAVLGRTLVALGHRSIAVEDPSYWHHRELLVAAGLGLVPLAVDRHGLRVDRLGEDGTDAVMTTPAHHTPLGVVLAPARRAALARWVGDGDRLVVEDDYDGELRYDRRPVAALQSLDPARIVYCGSASKALAPGLRIAWCVPPVELLPAVLAAQAALGGQPVSVLEQLVVAELLASGRYDDHVRRIRADYKRRRDDLVDAVANRLPGVRVEGVAAGLKALLRLPAGTDEALVVAALADRGVAVVGLDAFRAARADGPDPEGSPDRRPAIVVNYARPFAHASRGATSLLVEALAEVLGAASGPATP